MVPKWDDDENIHYFLQKQKNGTNLFKFPILYSQDLKIDGVKHYMWDYSEKEGQIVLQPGNAKIMNRNSSILVSAGGRYYRKL